MKLSKFKEDYKLFRHASVILKDWRLYALLFPIILWYILWIYKPMGGLLIAFKNYQPNLGIFGSDFVALPTSTH